MLYKQQVPLWLSSLNRAVHTCQSKPPSCPSFLSSPLATTSLISRSVSTLPCCRQVHLYPYFNHFKVFDSVHYIRSQHRAPSPLSKPQTRHQPRCKPSAHSPPQAPTLPLQPLAPTRLLSASLLHLLWIVHRSGTTCHLSCLTQHHVLRGHSCSTWQCPIPSYG